MYLRSIWVIYSYNLTNIKGSCERDKSIYDLLPSFSILFSSFLLIVSPLSLAFLPCLNSILVSEQAQKNRSTREISSPKKKSHRADVNHTDVDVSLALRLSKPVEGSRWVENPCCLFWWFFRNFLKLGMGVSNSFLSFENKVQFEKNTRSDQIRGWFLC